VRYNCKALSIWAGVACLLLSSLGLPADLPAADRVVKVFILAGQGNMLGTAKGVHLDTYRADPLIAPAYPHLRDGDGWKKRYDVFTLLVDRGKVRKSGPLTMGFGASGDDSFGPELGFGHVVGEAFKEPVVILKLVWGGSTLYFDFRPPSMPPTQKEVADVLALRMRSDKSLTADALEAQFGSHYRQLVSEVNRGVESIPQHYPNLVQYKPEIAGFVWHHTWNDKLSRELKTTNYDEYSDLLAAFIRDLRKDLNVPRMPFVIGEHGVDGVAGRGAFQEAQTRAAAQDEFLGNVALVRTAEFWDSKAQELFEKNYWKGTPEQKAEFDAVGADRPYLYLGAGKTFFAKGVAFGEAILTLQPIPKDE